MRMLKTTTIAVFLLCIATTAFAYEPDFLIKRKSQIEDDSLRVDVKYNGVLGRNIRCRVIISNNSNDTLSVDPRLSYYVQTEKQQDTLSDNFQRRFYSVALYELITKFNQLDPQKSTMRNPFSLDYKSTGAIIKDGLISGTVGAIFGIKPEEMEKQALIDEVDWYRTHYSYLENPRVLLKTEKGALSAVKIPPYGVIKGDVYFPWFFDIKEMEIRIPIKKNRYAFTMKQFL